MNSQHGEIFLYYLDNLLKLIEKIEEHVQGKEEILEGRLAKDMFPLKVQVKIAINFSLRACFKQLNKEIPELGSDIDHFAGLKNLISQTLAYIRNLETPNIEHKNHLINDQAGFNNIALLDSSYINTFALPNFFFHLSMVYAIAKHHGVPVTKGDFDGIHSYPEGFSWEK